jgi:hypothetical protein
VIGLFWISVFFLLVMFSRVLSFLENHCMCCAALQCLYDMKLFIFFLTQIAGWTIESGKKWWRSRIKIVFGSSAWAGNIYIMKFYTILMAWNKLFKYNSANKLHYYLGFIPDCTTREEWGWYITFFQVIWSWRRGATVLNIFFCYFTIWWGVKGLP